MTQDETGATRPPPLIKASELPGPMSLNHLADLGAICKLDNTNAYRSDDADTLYGRALIAAKVVPYATAACAMTAFWVWMGGRFPDTVDVISNSHYRSLSFGRKIRVFNRKAPPEHLTMLGPLRITTPVRTACDLALLPFEDLPRQKANALVCALMEAHHFRPADCLAILEDNRFWQNAPRARAFFEYIKHCF